MATTKQVDFSNVKDGGNFNRRRVPAGDYLAVITKVEDAKAKDDVFQYLFSIKLVKRPASVFPYYCKLQENQLWKLRNLLIAGGLSVPKKRQRVDPNRLVNKQIGVTIEDADFEGKEQSEIAGVFPAAELDDQVTGDDEDEPEEDEDEDEDASEDTDEDEAEDEAEEAEDEADEDEAEEDEEEEDPLAALDRNALKAEIKKFQADFQARKSQTDDDLRDVLREKQAAAKPKTKPAVKATTKKKPINEVSDDELEELDIDSL